MRVQFQDKRYQPGIDTPSIADEDVQGQKRPTAHTGLQLASQSNLQKCQQCAQKQGR